MGRLQNPGFMRRSVWDPFQESMRMAIPLILQKNRLAQRKAEVDQRFELEGQEIVQKAEEAKLEAASKALGDKLKLQGDMFEADLEDKLEREKLAGTERRHSETLGVSKSRLELERQRLNKEKTHTLSPGQILVGPKGKQIAAGKEKSSTSNADLTRAALKGDKEAQAILDETQKRKIEISAAQGLGAMQAKMGIIDIEGTARAILDGRENIENVKNTFGVAVQEAIRKEVLSKDPKFNFNQPRVKLAAIKQSLGQQQKQRGMMGSFVKNLNKQLDRLGEITNDVISRIGFRALDLPIREFKTRFRGSGHEKTLEAYLVEISNEIGKLSTGSAASIRELSTDAQERWAKIHDPNLSIKELKIILDETRLMADMRLESTEDEILETMQQLENTREIRRLKPGGKKKKSGRFKILKVE